MSEREIDQTLVERAQGGDKLAFDQLVSKYQRKLVRLLSREVQAIGPNVWRITHQNMAVTDDSRIIGAPQVGDWAAFEGRVLADGSRVADRITLLERRVNNTFSFIGMVEGIAPDAWTISGRTVRVDALTQIQPGLQVSDTVKVQGGLAPDGTFWAASIQRFETLRARPLVW